MIYQRWLLFNCMVFYKWNFFKNICHHHLKNMHSCIKFIDNIYTTGCWKYYNNFVCRTLEGPWMTLKISLQDPSWTLRAPYWTLRDPNTDPIMLLRSLRTLFGPFKDPCPLEDPIQLNCLQMKFSILFVHIFSQLQTTHVTKGWNMQTIWFMRGFRPFSLLSSCTFYLLLPYFSLIFKETFLALKHN